MPIPKLSHKQRSKLQGLLKKFEKGETRRPGPIDTKSLEAFLSNAPEHVYPQDLVPLNELEERLAHINDIQSFIRGSNHYNDDWCFKAVELSMLMVVPLDRLRHIGEMIREEFDAKDLVERLRRISGLVDQFLFVSNIKELGKAGDRPRAKGAMAQSEVQGGMTESSLKRKESDAIETSSKRSKRSKQTGDKDSNATTEPLKKDKTSRNKAQRDICLERDEHVCIITGTPYPQVCHIVPFSFNSSESNLARTRETIRACAVWYKRSDLAELETLLMPKLGCSDQSWNMLSLSSMLHTWWGLGLFAFKCLGITAGEQKWTVRLQFRWMVRSKENPTRRMEADDARTFVGTGIEPTDSNLRVFTQSGRRVMSGDVFEIQMDEESAVKMKWMIDLQWSLIVIAAMSGAAESPELLDDEPDDGGFGQALESLNHWDETYPENPRTSIERWLDQLPAHPSALEQLRRPNINADELRMRHGNVPRPPGP